MPKRVLVLLPYPPGRAPSQRFRIEHFISLMKEEVGEVTLAPFLDEATWAIFYRKGMVGQKAWGLLKGYLRRYKLLFGLKQYDIIWIHRETSPMGLPVLAWCISKLWKVPYIFEFDDAIWMKNVSAGNRLFSFLKPHGNALYLMRNSRTNVCGNAWLTDFAKTHNPNSVCIPTVVDTQGNHNREQDQSTNRPVIGWTGSHSTLRYLEMIAPQLRNVYAQFPFELVVISDVAPGFQFPELRFIPWSADREADDLLEMHIGLMPLPEADWARGKCGLKLIQYMAMGIVPVASGVGVNTTIVEDGVNGFICNSNEAWESALIKLLQHTALRQDMARTCRPKIEAEYAVEAQRDKFLHLFA